MECKICHRKFKNINYLSSHIKKSHENTKHYYDTYIKKENDGICKICGNTVEFISIGKGYKKICSRECNNKIRKKSHFEKYGVENPFQRENIKNQIKQTHLANLGVENPFQSKKIIKQIKQTNLERYGVEIPARNVNVKIKTKQTNLERYGVEHPLQNSKIFIKNQKSGFRIKKFKGTNIYYRGTYELDFLEKYYSKYPDIVNAPKIKYKYKNKNCIYFPDFYIPSLNLIIEVKNSYLYKKNKDRIESKKKSVINNNFNFEMIIDKNYNKINL